MEQTNKKVVLLEDNQEHFTRITDILKNSGCNIVLAYEDVTTLMANYDAFKTSAPCYKRKHKANVQSQVSTIDADCWWLIDVNWTGQAKETDADEYGLNFHADFSLETSKTVILSVNPKEKYRTAVNGLVYISKADESGNLFPTVFENQLLKALGITPSKSESPYEKK